MGLVLNLVLKPFVWLIAMVAVSAVAVSLVGLVIYFPIALVIGVAYLFSGELDHPEYLLVWLVCLSVFLVAGLIMVVCAVVMETNNWA